MYQIIIDICHCGRDYFKSIQSILIRDLCRKGHEDVVELGRLFFLMEQRIVSFHYLFTVIPYKALRLLRRPWLNYRLIMRSVRQQFFQICRLRAMAWFGFHGASHDCILYEISSNMGRQQYQATVLFETYENYENSFQVNVNY